MGRRAFVYAVLVAFLSSAISTAVCLVVLVRSEQKWCEVMVLLDEGYNAPVQPGQPPLNERGRRVAAAISGLRDSLGCD